MKFDQIDVSVRGVCSPHIQPCERGRGDDDDHHDDEGHDDEDENDNENDDDELRDEDDNDQVREQAEECVFGCLWAECGFECPSSDEMVSLVLVLVPVPVGVFFFLFRAVAFLK